MAGLNFKFLLDTSEMKQKADEAIAYISNIGQAPIDTSGIQQSYQSMGQALENAMSRADAVFDSVLSSGEGAVDITSMLGVTFNEVSQTVEAMNASVETQEGVIANLSSQYDALSQAREQANTAGDTAKVESLTASMQSLREQINEESNALSGMQGAMSQATAQIQAMGQTAEQTGSINMTEQLEQGLSILPAPLQSAINGIRGMTKAGLKFIMTPLGAVIGAISLAILAMTKYFQGSEEGQLKFAKVTGYVSGILGELGDVAIKIGKFLVNLFVHPIDSLKSFGSNIKGYFVSVLESAGGVAKAVGDILKSAFTLDLDGAKDALSDLKKHAKDLAKKDPIVMAVTATAKFAQNTHKDAMENAKISREEKELEIKISKWQERKAELEKLKADAQILMYDSNADAGKRKQALANYKSYIEEEKRTELAYQDEKISLLMRSQELTENTAEDNDELRKLKAERIRIESKASRELAMLARRSGGINKAGDKINDKAEQERKALEDYNKQIKATVEKGAFELEALRIRAMEDGFAKREALAQLNHEKAKAEAERMKQEMIEAYAERNKKKTSSVKFEDLNADEQKAYQQAIEKADTELANAQKANMQSVLSEAKTYQQQRLEIEQEFQAKRKALYTTDEQGNEVLKKDVSQGNVDELNRQEEDSLSKIDQQFASRSEEFQAWMGEIANISLEQLQATLTQAEEELKNMQDKGGGDPQKQAVALAKVATLKKKIAKESAKAKLNPKARTIKEWQDLHRTLNECTKSFKNIGQTVGGTAGKILQTAGEIAGATLGMINSIMQLVQMSSGAMTATASVASKSVSTVEKASVILTVISTALQLAMMIASLFDNSETQNKKIKRLQEEIDQLEWELNNKGMAKLIKEKGTALEFVEKVMEETIVTLYKQTEATKGSLAAFLLLWEGFQKGSPLMTESVRRIADEFAKVDYSATKALGTAKFKDARKDLENMAQQQVLLQQQIEAEKGKKDSKQDQGKSVGR